VKGGDVAVEGVELALGSVTVSFEASDVVADFCALAVVHHKSVQHAGGAEIAVNVREGSVELVLVLHQQEAASQLLLSVADAHSEISYSRDVLVDVDEAILHLRIACARFAVNGLDAAGEQVQGASDLCSAFSDDSGRVGSPRRSGVECEEELGCAEAVYCGYFLAEAVSVGKDVGDRGPIVHGDDDVVSFTGGMTSFG
jgi:hypothetical protein